MAARLQNVPRNDIQTLCLIWVQCVVSLHSMRLDIAKHRPEVDLRSSGLPSQSASKKQVKTRLGFDEDEPMIDDSFNIAENPFDCYPMNKAGACIN